MNVLIFEPGSGGHRYVYVRHIIHALRAFGGGGARAVLVTVEQGPRSPEFDTLRPLRDDFELDACMREVLVAGLSRRGLAQLAGSHLDALADAVRRHRPDHIYIPSADGLAQYAGLRRLTTRGVIPGGIETEVCVHRGNFAYPAAGRKRLLADRISLLGLSRAPWSRVHFVDLLVYEWLAARGGALSRRSVLLPDPVDPVPPMDRAAARDALGIPREGRILGFIGGSDMRKRLDLLVDAFARAPLAPGDRLLLAGLREEPMRERLRTVHAGLVQGGRIISIDRFLTDDEFLVAMQASDVVATTYSRQQGISAICLRAVAAGRPVLASDFGWMGRIVPSFDLGWTCRVEDPEAYAAAIPAALDAAEGWRPSARARRLLAFHAPENFAACWTARLRERAGLPPAPGMLEWSAVAEDRES